MNYSLQKYSEILKTRAIKDAPCGLHFEYSEHKNIIDANQCGNKITLVTSTPYEYIEDVLIHELSHWIIGKNWLFEEHKNWHGEYFLAMQLKMYGSIQFYSESYCFELDKLQPGYSKQAFLVACEIFNKLNKQELSVDEFARSLTEYYNVEKKKTLKYKANKYAALACYAAIAGFVACVYFQII